MNFHLEPRALNSSVFVADGLVNTPHLHRHIEIIYMQSGTARAIAGSKEVCLEPGDLFIAFPNEIHYYHNGAGQMQAVVLIVSPDLCPEFHQDFKSRLPVSPLMKNAVQNPTILAAIDGVVARHFENSRFADTAIKGHLLILLSELLKVLPLEEKRSQNTTLLPAILRYCADHYTDDISLDTLAATLQVSPYYLSHFFNERLHIRFRDYVNSLRVAKACELLETGDQSITEIAFEVGYNSTRTFNRCFLGIMKMTPKTYRHNLLQHLTV